MAPLHRRAVATPTVTAAATLVSIACTLLPATARAEPIELPMTGTVLDESGQPVTDETEIQVTLQDSQGNLLHEIRTDIQITRGRFDLSLGTGTPLDSNLFSQHSDLSVQIALLGQTIRMPMVAQPYAFSSHSADASNTAEQATDTTRATHADQATMSMTTTRSATSTTTDQATDSDRATTAANASYASDADALGGLPASAYSTAGHGHNMSCYTQGTNTTVSLNQTVLRSMVCNSNYAAVGGGAKMPHSVSRVWSAGTQYDRRDNSTRSYPSNDPRVWNCEGFTLNNNQRLDCYVRCCRAD